MNPQDWLAALTWRDGLDFALLFLLVYGLLLLVKGTRAVPVLASVSVVGVVAWGVSALDLVASASILKYFFESVILLLIVVFQQELRRALLVLGQRLLPSSRREAARSAVEELVAGLDRLQRARIGALVVLQGDISLMDLVTGKGALVDAPLRAETLVALSIPHAANTAHDGAILVEDFRIERAGVICPLSEQTMDPRFGTRHRGAVGITEESDALALVLSEERGELRIAERGEMSEPVKVADLEVRIERWLTQPRADVTKRSPGESRADLRQEELGAELSRSGPTPSASAVELTQSKDSPQARVI